MYIGARLRALKAHELLEEFLDEDEHKMLVKIEILTEEYDILDGLKKKWQNETNSEFRALERDPARVLKIAAIENRLGINHRQATGTRIINAKVAGPNGRAIIQYTETGIKFGGGLVSDYAKHKALNNYEYYIWC